MLVYVLLYSIDPHMTLQCAHS